MGFQNCGKGNKMRTSLSKLLGFVTVILGTKVVSWYNIFYFYFYFLSTFFTVHMTICGYSIGILSQNLTRNLRLHQMKKLQKNNIEKI